MTTATLEGVLADRDGWRAEHCSIAGAVDVVGTRSAILLIREAYYGARRFDEFVRRAELTEAVASTRLRQLVALGVFVKVPYQEPGQRTRYEYELTTMGTDFLPVIVALMRWGDRYVAADGGPLALRHRDCGAGVDVHVQCSAGHDVPLDELGVRARRSRRTPG